MSQAGRKVVFHGAFATKAAALRKERSLGRGAFVKPIKIRGGDGARRFLVLTKR